LDEGKKPIRIKLKIGSVEAEIECAEDQLKDAVQHVLSAVQEQIKTEKPVETFPPLRTDTCKSIIRGLWAEGWFSVARNLGDAYEEMSKGGYHFDRTAVAHSLVDLVREGYLTRLGRPRRYQYLQKRPPSQ